MSEAVLEIMNRMVDTEIEREFSYFFLGIDCTLMLFHQYESIPVRKDSQNICHRTGVMLGIPYVSVACVILRCRNMSRMIF